MGDPRRIRKKFSGPSHPWQKERIDEEKNLLKDYGLKNKREVWKATSKLRNFKIQTKKIIRTKSEQSEKEKIQLLKKLVNLGILNENAGVEEILGLPVNVILERRLQSVVFRRGLARSMNQSRQFIAHEHIMVDNKKMTAPGFLVPKALEGKISFSTSSSLFSEMHPERVKEEKMPKKPEQKKEDKKHKKETKKQGKKTFKEKPKEEIKEKKAKKEEKKEVKQEKKE